MSYLKNHKVLLVVIAVLLISNIALLFFKSSGEKDGSPKPDNVNPREMVKKKLKEDVGFSDEQLAIYDSLRKKHFESLHPMLESLKMSKDSLFKLVFTPGTPDSVIRKYADKIAEKQEAIDLKTFNHFRSLKAICTEEQQPKIDTFIQQIVKRIINGGRRNSSPDRKK